MDSFEAMHSAPLKLAFVALASTFVPGGRGADLPGGPLPVLQDADAALGRDPRHLRSSSAPPMSDGATTTPAWSSAPPLVVLAAVYCLAYERTGTIGTTIVAHALFNLNMTILILVGVGS